MPKPPNTIQRTVKQIHTFFFQNFNGTRSSTHIFYKKPCLSVLWWTGFFVFLYESLFESQQNTVFYLYQSVIFGLIPLGVMENVKPFRLTKLNDCNGDLNGRWCVYFWTWDAQRASMVRKRDYKINNYKTAAERKAYFYQRKRIIDNLLKKGYHIDRTKLDPKKTLDAIPENEKPVLTMEQAIETAYKISVNNNIAHTSALSYASAKRIFLRYLKKHRMLNDVADSFSKADAVKFCDYLKQTRSGQTVNKYVTYMKAFWGLLVERELLENNPWRKLRKQKEVATNINTWFPPEEKKKLIAAIREADKELYVFIQIVYNTFSRPNEVRQLRVSDVRINTGKIFISSAVSKNKKNEFVTIPDHLKPVLEDFTANKNTNDYLFEGKNGPIGKNRMYDRHRKHLKRMGIAEDKTLYSWKHTGVCDAFLAGIDLKRIQAQCRHHSIQQTDTYLKSLGLYENVEIKLKMPKL